MPPILALILWTIFVLFLLRLGHKQSPNVSLALWIPTIWMLLIASKPLGLWFESGGGTVEEGSPIDRVFLSTLLCLGFIILVGRKFNLSSVIKKNPWAMLLIGYMLISVLWSEYPYTSLKRVVRELVAFVMAMIVATEEDPRKALQCIFRRIIYILIPFSLLLIKYYRNFGVEYGRYSGEEMWIGVGLQKNSLGRLCLFAFFFLIWTFIRRWQGRDTRVALYQTPVEVFLLFLTIWLFTGPKHILTYSAASIAALAVGLVALVCFLWMKKLNLLIGANSLTVIIAIIVIYGTITPFVGTLTIFDVTSLLGREESLTGRSEIWAKLIPYAMQKPILGYGFGGFWTEELQTLINVNAHNGYLDQILNLGFVGHILFSIYLLSCCRIAQREMSKNFDWGVLSTCLILMAVVHNIAESTITSFTTLLSAVILFLLISSTAVNHLESFTRRKVYPKEMETISSET